jgi:hypothetical protein
LKYLSADQAEEFADELKAHLPRQFNLEEAMEACNPQADALTKKAFRKVVLGGGLQKTPLIINLQRHPIEH